MKKLIVVILFILATLLAGCKDKQEVAQEQSKEAVKKMFSREPEYRSYDQIQKDRRAKEEKEKQDAKR